MQVVVVAAGCSRWGRVWGEAARLTLGRSSVHVRAPSEKSHMSESVAPPELTPPYTSIASASVSATWKARGAGHAAPASGSTPSHTPPPSGSKAHSSADGRSAVPPPLPLLATPPRRIPGGGKRRVAILLASGAELLRPRQASSC